MNWILYFAPVAGEIAQLLGCQFVTNSPAMNTMVGGMIREIFVSNNDGDLQSRDLLTLRLQFLAKHLRELKAGNAEAFEQLRRELLAKDKDNIGTQFEIEVAASLVRKGVSFEKRERPDFYLKELSASLWLECTSVQVVDGSRKTGLTKLVGAIRSKQKLRYANASTALLVEASGVYSRVYFPTRDEISDQLKLLTGKKQFGSILVFCKIYENPMIKTVYLRFDQKRISSDLSRFLDSQWPSGLVPSYPDAAFKH